MSIDTLKTFGYTKDFSTHLNIEREGIFSKINGQKVATFQNVWVKSKIN
jgi:hypothetical protein